MKTPASVLATMFVTLVPAASAVAADAADGKNQAAVQDWNSVTFFSAIGVFLVALYILSKTAWPKIVGGLEARENKIRSEIEAAEEAKKKSEEALSELDRVRSEAKAEAQKMVEATKAEQARLAADLKIEAEKELTQLRESAMRNIEAAKRAALNEIYAESAVLATNIAEKILEREVNAEDQKRLVDQSVAEFTNQFQHS
ncbi:MAG: F0F1 ATP synthase subunit B [Planctomycetota bacterium]